MPLVVRKTRGFSVGMVTDSHGGSAANMGNFATSVLWLRAQTPRPALLIHAGDLTCGNLDDVIANHYEAQWVLEDVGWPFNDWVELVTIGNHDTQVPINGTPGTTPASPHSFMITEYDHLFHGREYYHYDYESLRVIVMNNLTDYLQGDASTAYYNCNPPGADDEVNPDYSGITTPGSTQRLWLDQVSSSNHLWKIGVCHRALWTPFDSDPRKMNKAARPALKTPIENGLSLLFQGDIHLGSFSGPWYPDPDDATEANATHRGYGEVAAYSLSLSGGYFPRNVDVSKLPGYTGGDVDDAANSTSVHWSSGLNPGNRLGLCQAAHLRFEGDLAYLTIFECTNADPTGSVVYTDTLIRNPGL